MVTEENKKKIDNMTQVEMAMKVRFAPVGDPLFLDDVGKYFYKVFNKKGGMTPEISKRIGWDKVN